MALLTIAYVRDDLGRIVTKTETIDGVTTTYGYTYDLAGRLTDVTRDAVAVAQYTYDANGNRLSHATPTTSVTGTYDDQDRLLSYGTASYTYADSGELETKVDGATSETTSYEYDALGNLRTVVLPNGTVIEYLVDGENRRVGKKIGGVLSKGWIFRDALQPVAALDDAGNVVARFVYATGENVPELMMKGGVTYRIVTDHLGSPRIVVDSATGTIAQRMDYDEFGNVVFDTNPGFQPFGFAGGLYDADAGLVRFGARDYDPHVGRWMAKDPTLLIDGPNLYVYVANDPLNGEDPDGRARVFCKKAEHGALCAEKCGMAGLYCPIALPHPYGSGGVGSLYQCNSVIAGKQCSYSYPSGDACHLFANKIKPVWFCIYAGGEESLCDEK